MSQQFPARFKVSGTVLNVFTAPSGKTREGREYGGDTRVQLLSQDTLKNGEVKVVQTELAAGDRPEVLAAWQQLVGKVVTVPASVYAINGDLRVQLANPNAVPTARGATPASTPAQEAA